jgi:hypothetical protein
MHAEIPAGFLKIVGYQGRRGSLCDFGRHAMASLATSRTTAQIRPSGLAGLFGLFAGLCAVFAACGTLVDWHDEFTQRRWPVVPAIVEGADVQLSRRAAGEAGGTSWKLRARLRYEAGGKSRIAVLTSRTVYSEREAAQLHAWAEQHRPHSQIEIRYDPRQQGRVAFASAEGPFTSERVRTDLILFTLAAIASAALLELAKMLRRREANYAPAADGGQGGNLAVGLFSAAAGLMITGLALDRAIHAAPLTADSLMALPAGLMFVFAGILIGLPPQYERWRSLIATLLVTCFAITFDWVAFAPGERHFTGSINGIGFVPGETMGRFFFGIFAVLLDICAVGMWIGQLHQTSVPSARAAKPADSTI